MGKLIGYITALAGLGLLILSFSMKNLNIALPSFIQEKQIVIGGIILVIIGIILSLGKRSSSYNVKHAAEEVPIYEGEGRKKRIVGYKRG
jgi:hypothetical protein